MITFKRDVAVLGEHCPVESAEELFSWLVTKPTRKVDASACEQLHTAVLQVLLMCRPKLTQLPTSPMLRSALAGLAD